MILIKKILNNLYERKRLGGRRNSFSFLSNREKCPPQKISNCSINLSDQNKIIKGKINNFAYHSYFEEFIQVKH